MRDLIIPSFLLLSATLYAQSARRDSPRPRFTGTAEEIAGPAASSLPTWTGSFTYNGKTYSFTMVGTDPSAGSKITRIPVYIVPLKLTFMDGTILDANAPMQGQSISAVQAVEMSPVFQPVTWTEGSAIVGTTQYIDAFQRANFWSSVGAASKGYHVVLTPIVLPEQSFSVSASQGSTQPGPQGSIRATVSNSLLDNTITPQVFQNFPQLTKNVFTIFLTYNVFPGGAYGFHDVWRSSPGKGNTYSYVSYLEPWTDPIDADISTLSHEVAEWMDDPYVNNSTPCGILEVGDALSDVIFTVDSNGMTWHPQDLLFLPWFTYQQPSTSINGWYTFHNTFTAPCRTH